MKPAIRAALAGALAIGFLALRAGPAAAASVRLAMPDPGEVAYSAYVAQAMGYWKARGLDVDVELITGPANVQALLAGEVEFAEPGGTTLVAAASHHVPLMGLINLLDGLPNEIVLRNDVAAKTGLSVATSTTEQRARALRGFIFGSSPPNTILDAFLQHVLVQAGVNADQVTRTPMDTVAEGPAMEQGRIDGFSSQPPWSTLTADRKTGVIWISGPRGDVPDTKGVIYGAVAARSDYCPKNPKICADLVAGIRQAQQFIKTQPDQAVPIIAPHLKGFDPETIRASIMAQRPLIDPVGKLTEAEFVATQKFMVEQHILKPEEALSQFSGIAYSNAYNE